MKSLLMCACFFLLSSTCFSRSALDDEEDSVVSIYTTQPTTTRTNRPLDVYQQIANNIADRITSPIYRFLGLGGNKTEERNMSPKKNWGKIESLDEVPEVSTKAGIKPINNEISNDKDVEELSVEALKKNDKKPEKVILYSSYLPSEKDKLTQRNSTVNEISDDIDDEPFDFDDIENDDHKPKEGGFVYYMELIGSYLQLLWGALAAFFNRSR